MVRRKGRKGCNGGKCLEAIFCHIAFFKFMFLIMKDFQTYPRIEKTARSLHLVILPICFVPSSLLCPPFSEMFSSKSQESCHFTPTYFSVHLQTIWTVSFPSAMPLLHLVPVYNPISSVISKTPFFKKR